VIVFPDLVGTEDLKQVVVIEYMICKMNKFLFSYFIFAILGMT